MATSASAGFLIFLRGGTLFAMPLDLDKLEVHGTPVPVLEGVDFNDVNGSAEFDFSLTGTLLYRSGAGGLATVQWVDSQGATQPLLAKPGLYSNPKLAPDGKRLALTVREGSASDIWIYEWQRDTMTRLTFGAGLKNTPVWSPDGRYLAFRKSGALFWTRVDGASQPQGLTQIVTLSSSMSLSPDGRRLAFAVDGDASPELWTLPLETDGTGLRAGKPEVLLRTGGLRPAFSPDGNWLAYISNESGASRVYVRAFPDKGGKWQISNNGGAWAAWSRSGHELFFQETRTNRIMVASYAAKGDSFVAGKPRQWSEQGSANLAGDGNLDLAPDGKRIVALIPAEAPNAQQDRNHVIFLENFFDELRRRVPVGK